MSNKKTILILILIISVVMLLIATIIVIYTTSTKNEDTTNVQVDKDNLYFIIKNGETGYGICKTDGTIVVKPEYSQIARVDDSVYLKSDNDSYLFFLNDGKSVSLGGKESEVNFVYDEDGKLLPYYVLRYGESEEASIYRIYNDKGIRHDTKDFSSLNEAYKFLNAKEVFKPTIAPSSITNLYNVIYTLNYPTNEGKAQYIVTKKDKSTELQGLVDETGRIVLDFSYSKLSPVENSTNAIKAEKDNKFYVFLVSEKIFEVESGFDLVVSNGYFLQKRGNTVNKIYNFSGEIVVDGIYNVNEDLTLLNSESGTSYLLVQDKKETYFLYNLTNNKKSDIQYSKVLLDYLDKYSSEVKNTSFIYQNGSDYYAFDLDVLKSYKITATSDIFSPFDMGNVYKIK